MGILVGPKLSTITNSTTVNTGVAGYTVHTFSVPGSTTFSADIGGKIDVLVVGAGGYGGGPWSGGGGGGSVLYYANLPIKGGVSYPITVGSFPSGQTTLSYNGGTVIAPGGAGGSGSSNPLGSGAGGGWPSGAGGVGANITGYGFPGAPSSGGGGGAGGPGSGNRGGTGVPYTIRGTDEMFGAGGSGDTQPNNFPINFGSGAGPNNGVPGVIIIRYLT
jgi:hypothetical protein